MECNAQAETAPTTTLSAMETLLVVDDDDEIRELLCDYLSEVGYRVLAAADGVEMWRQLACAPVDLLVLDLMLPGEDGLSLCRQLQARPELGIVMLSAKGSAMDRIIGLEVGADDYLAKPFEPRELLARVKAVLRRAQRSKVPAQASAETLALPAETIRFGTYCLQPAIRLLIMPDGAALTLPRTDYRVLRDLLGAPEQVLSRDQLTRSALGRDHLPDDRSVDMCISRLRQHFKRAGDSAVRILTVRNEGYLLSLGA